MRPRVATKPAKAITEAIVLIATYPTVLNPLESAASLNEEPSDNRKIHPLFLGLEVKHSVFHC